MDQREIDEIMNKGNLTQIDKKQKEITQKLEAKGVVTPPPHRGEVIGQLSRVTEESEAGTNMVMNFLENVLTVLSKMKSFQKSTEAKMQAAPDTVKAAEVLTFYKDTVFLAEDLIFGAMDAFQFQDINRQKLLKVMFTLAKLNEYLNELLGTETDKNQQFGHNIESTTLQKDSRKDEVDSLIQDFQHK
jgi:hypothetical protein